MMTSDAAQSPPRKAFVILVGNTDDHARNYAAFWDGDYFTLTPAYDICPQSRVGREASQAMQIRGRERRSQLSLCLAAAGRFRLRDEEAIAIMKHQITTIRRSWDTTCDEARLNSADRRLLWRRQFLNDLAFEGLKDQLGESIGGLSDEQERCPCPTMTGHCGQSSVNRPETSREIRYDITRGATHGARRRGRTSPSRCGRTRGTRTPGWSLNRNSCRRLPISRRDCVPSSASEPVRPV